MPAASSVYISGAVEGRLDEAVLRRLIEEAGASVSDIHKLNGKNNLLKGMKGFNDAARFAPWVLLIDLDHDFECAPPAKEKWLAQPAPKMCFRVAVREIEAWLMADQERLAGFLGVAKSRIPAEPGNEEDPKRKMVQLAASSRRRAIREDMAPRPGSGREVGSAYTSRLIEFVQDAQRGWQPVAAAQNADSLARCISCVKRLALG